MFNDPKYNVTYFNLHGIYNMIIKCKIEKVREIVGADNIDKNRLINEKNEIDIILDQMSKIYLPFILEKSNHNKKLKRNKSLRRVYDHMCFVIDNTVGYSFYRVLLRLLIKYLSRNYKEGTNVAAKKDKKFIL